MLNSLLSASPSSIVSHSFKGFCHESKPESRTVTGRYMGGGYIWLYLFIFPLISFSLHLFFYPSFEYVDQSEWADCFACEMTACVDAVLLRTIFIHFSLEWEVHRSRLINHTSIKEHFSLLCNAIVDWMAADEIHWNAKCIKFSSQRGKRNCKKRISNQI